MIETATTADDRPILRVAALYRFVRIEDPVDLRVRLETVCRAGGVLGTMLIATEGINGTIAGSPEAIDAVLTFLRTEPGLDPMEIKFASAGERPFHRLKVRVKREIVTMGRPDVDGRDAGDYVAPEDWNAVISDPSTLVIDTRNAYEVAIGSFEGAIDPTTSSFSDFPAWFEAVGRDLIAASGARTVAMFCTGGIRCEKATALLRAEGIADVRHLKGGILRYLETVPEAESLWRGECFVFDERVSVGNALSPGIHTLCRGCRTPLSPDDRRHPNYREGVSCARCHEDARDRLEARIERHHQVTLARARGLNHIGDRPERRASQVRDRRSEGQDEPGRGS